MFAIAENVVILCLYECTYCVSEKEKRNMVVIIVDLKPVLGTEVSLRLISLDWLLIRAKLSVFKKTT